MHRALLCLPLLLALAAGGCVRPYRASVTQGNLIEADALARLETGMTRAQVEFLLGRPILQDPLDPRRWNYAFYARYGYRPPLRTVMVLYFDENDRLARIEGIREATADDAVEDQLNPDRPSDDRIDDIDLD